MFRPCVAYRGVFRRTVIAGVRGALQVAMAAATDFGPEGADEGGDLHPSVEGYLTSLFKSAPGMQEIVVSNSEGHTLLRVRHPEAPSDSSVAARQFASVFALASDQTFKLPFGTSTSTTVFFEHMVLVQLDAFPLVISLVGVPDACIGAMLDLRPQLKEALKPIVEKAEEELA